MARQRALRLPSHHLTPPLRSGAGLLPHMLGLNPGVASRQIWVAPNPAAVQQLTEKRYCVDVAAIIRLGAVSGTTVAEEPRRVRIGAEAEILDACESRAFEPRLDVSRQVEHRMAGAAGH